MKKRSITLACLSFILMIMAGTAFAQSAADYKAKIEALNKEMAKNMVAGTNDKIMSLYTDDAISLPSYEPLMDGIAAIKKANSDMAKSGWKCLMFEPTTLKVIPNGNMVTEIGTYKISSSMPGMNKPMDDHGKYLTIWEKQKDGSLKIKVETWNSDVDPTHMMKTADQGSMEK